MISIYLISYIYYNKKPAKIQILAGTVYIKTSKRMLGKNGAKMKQNFRYT